MDLLQFFFSIVDVHFFLPVFGSMENAPNKTFLYIYFIAHVYLSLAGVYIKGWATR